MPALPPVPGVFKFLLQWGDGTDTNALSVLHFQYSGAVPTGVDWNNYCSAFNGLQAAEWPIVLDSSSSYMGCAAIDLSVGGAEGGTAASVVGTRAGNPIGAASSCLIHYPISRRYRGGKPRTYLPMGTDADLLTRQTWTGAFLSAIETFWNTVRVAAVDAGPVGASVVGSQVAVSYYGPPNRLITGSTGRVRTISTVRATPIVDVLSSFQPRPKVASQRRRNLQLT